MGASLSASLGLAPEDVLELRHSSHFSAEEIRSLFRRFQFLDRDQSGGLSYEELMAIPEFAMNPMAQAMWATMLALEAAPLPSSFAGDRAYAVKRPFPLSRQSSAEDLLRQQDGDDGVCDGVVFDEHLEVTFPTFCRFLSAFHARAVPAAKLQLAFAVYAALEHDSAHACSHGRFGVRAVQVHLRAMLGKHLGSRDIEELARRTVEAADSNGDGWIDLADFTETIDLHGKRPFHHQLMTIDFASQPHE